MPTLASLSNLAVVQAVGLKHVMLPDVISNHVLPALPAADADSHISYLALIVSSGLTAPEALNASLAAKIIDGIKASKKVVTNLNFRQLERDYLHLPVSLGNKVTPENTPRHHSSKLHLAVCSCWHCHSTSRFINVHLI